MRASEFLSLAWSQFSPRERRIWLGHGRAHIELRLLATEELQLLDQQLQERVNQEVGLHWAEVHQQTGRLVLAYQPDAFDEFRLRELITELELLTGLARAEFSSRHHVADKEEAERIFLELCADAVGLVAGVALKFSLLPRSRLAGALSSALTVVRSVPRLSRPLAERWGDERVDLVLSLSISLLQGPAQRPLNAMVGFLERLSLAGELNSQRALFEKRESRLFPGGGVPAPRVQLDRPVPLPRGPVEDYSDRAWAVALGGFGVSFLTTRSVQRAFGALFGGLPRPAKLGREVFSSGLSRLLAGRHMLVLNDRALRRLDRVDCLVIQGDLMPGAGASTGRLIVLPGTEEAPLRKKLSELFDQELPLAVQQRSGWRLAPLGLFEVDLPSELQEAAQQAQRQGSVVLALDKSEQLRALVEVRLLSRLGLDELVRAAHDAAMRVVVASDDPDLLQAVPADDTFGAGEAFFSGVRELQRAGRTVLVVTQGDSRALDAADVGIALVPDGDQAPPAADIICRNDLTDVRLLIEACRLARDVSRQSVNIALGAATLGSLASAGGLLPMTTSRVLTVVNLASLISMGNGVRVSSELSRRPLPPARDPTPWHAIDPEGVLTRLGSSKQGLSRRKALSREPARAQKNFPLNDLARAVGDELFNPLVPLLAAGAGLSAVVGGMADAAMVGGVVGLNAVFGGVQTYRAERAIDALTQSARTTVVVRRDGAPIELSEDELVIGDVVLFSAGDLISSDCRILESRGLMVDSSALTGESLPVAKSARPSFAENISDRSSMLYQGTAVASGQALAVVVATGEATEARRGAASFRVMNRESGVEKRMRELMDLTAPMAIAAGAGVIGAGLLRGRKVSELVGSAVSLAVASVPEGLPLLATAAQLAAAKRLAKHGALVRNVRSLEALGRVDTVCFDKTGTVTSGSVELSLLGDGENEEALPGLSATRVTLVIALRATPLRPGDFDRCDPVDVALWRASDVERMSVHTQVADQSAELGQEGALGEEPKWERIDEIPFDAENGYSAHLGRQGELHMIAVKGAPEVLIDACRFYRRKGQCLEIDTEVHRELSQHAMRIALKGLRVLAVAQRVVSPTTNLDNDQITELEFVGFLAFRDPVRPTAKMALGQLRRAGLKPIIITGDHPSTARAVAVELEVSADPQLLVGADLLRLDETQLAEKVQTTDVFARVTPSQKVRVVRALSRAGRTVAMVGDGANDAAAIRLAQVGVAMGENASEGARNAADIVLTDPRIETLVQAIIEGRAMWGAVRDAVSILVGGNLGEIGFTLLGGLVSGRPPLSPRQLLLVNLFTDVAPATALALRAPREDSLEELINSGPDASMGWELDRDIGARALVTASGAGLAFGVSSLIGDRRGASTTALLALVGTQLGQTLISGQRNSQTILTSALSSLGLALIVQTPGLSRAFGCRPLSPIGFGIAMGSSAFATTFATQAPTWLESWLADHPLRWRFKEWAWPKQDDQAPLRGLVPDEGITEIIEEVLN
ncbi:MAG: cation-translocating P-type ATPase [Polyangiaceae bacterium]|nr:cation-translocating P-type ATPase [Polyangiaceae bacterium]